MNLCPDDILRYIFETVVETVPDSPCAIEIAIGLSHVSRHWRTIALKTPQIWRRLAINIIVDTDGHKQECQDRWDTICGRIKDVPADIEIYYIGYKDSMPLENCNLFMISRFSRLHLDLFPYRAKEEILQLSLPTKPLIESLEFHVRESFDFDAILHHFPPATRLIFSDKGAVLLSGAHTYPTVREIVAEYDVCLDFCAAFATFPSLTSVTGQDLQQTSFGPLGTLPHSSIYRLQTLPHLKFLSIYRRSLRSWLRAISCPSLEYFNSRGIGAEETIDFISSHPSITTFIYHHFTGFDRLASETSNIENLTLQAAAYEKCQASFQIPHFPKLRRLTLYDDMHSLMVDKFEFLVCARCLPVDHPRSTLPSHAAPIESLTIIVYPRHVHPPPMWRRGDLYDAAERTTELFDEGEVYRKYKERVGLRWIS